MNEADYGLLKMHSHQSASAANARRVDGADAYAENLRYDYLHSRHRMDQAGAFAHRIATESGSGRVRDLGN